MPSSWEEISNQFDKAEADKRQRKAVEHARKEREHEAALEEVAKADRLVQDFLRAARSVGNPGAKDEKPNALIFTGVKYWTSQPDVPLQRAGLGYGFPGDDFNPHDGIVVVVTGLWIFRNSGGGSSNWDNGYPGWHCDMGRKAGGLYCKSIKITTLREQTNALQRKLVVLMRENGIPLPS